MHELFLYGQIPQSRHDQLLHILAGLAAMQPQRLYERHAIYRPTRGPAQRQLSVGGSQGVKNPQRQALQQRLNMDLYFVQLVEALNEHDFGAVQNGETANDLKKSSWSMLFEDTPEPTKRSAGMRMVAENEISEGKPHEYMRGLGYGFVSEYLLEGHRFVHKNVVLVLHRIRRIPSSTAPKVDLPALNDLKLVDASGSYILHAYVRVQDAGKPDIMNKAIEELEKMKSLLKGVVPMSAMNGTMSDGKPERLCMDTRIK